MRIDIITGGDHGKGVFIAGSCIVVMLNEATQSKGQKIDSFSFEMSVAEIICRRENAEILSMTIHNDLAKSIDTIATNELNFHVNDKDKIDCCLGNMQKVGSNQNRVSV